MGSGVGWVGSMMFRAIGFASSYRALVALVVATAALFLVAPAASAERIIYTAASADGSSMDALDALTQLQGLVRYKTDCAGRLTASGARLEGDCRIDGSDRNAPIVHFDFRYSDYPQVEIKTCCGGAYQFVVHDRRDAPQTLLYEWPAFHRQGDDARWAVAWIVLAQPRAPREASDDAEFVAAASSVRDANPEQLRRTQVQVEAAMRDGRNLDAARLYRDALRSSPAWAAGHFNLGLLYGDLELYPEAITEMRRYLYLAPNADDARAVQDKIYEWEAAMAAPSAGAQ